MTQDRSTQFPGRRNFLKITGAAAAAASIFPGQALATGQALVKGFRGEHLQVWSCGGLAEAFIAANEAFEKDTRVKTVYTGAFAAALGKSLLGSGHTDVFAGRVLDLAEKLRKSGKMAYFKPLCFTEYVLVVPKGNPADIQSVHDLARPGVKVVLAPKASKPGGPATLILLEKAGVRQEALENAIVKGSCVQMVMPDIISGKGDVSVMERRLTRIPRFQGRVDVLPIPEEYFPPPPLTFTIGVMHSAANRQLSDSYVDFITSEQGQSFFERQGFIPAISAKGRELTEKLGVKDG